jgi:hypothetical protein
VIVRISGLRRLAVNTDTDRLGGGATLMAKPGRDDRAKASSWAARGDDEKLIR